MITRIAFWILAVSFLTSWARAEDSGDPTVRQENPASTESLSEESPASESFLGGGPPIEVAEIGQGGEGSSFALAPPSRANSFYMDYYGIFFGPALKNPSSLVPTPNGRVDPTLPLHFRNYLALGYHIDDQLSVSGTAFWIWKPVQGQNLAMRDPFLRLSDSAVISNEHFNLYSDIRTHFGVSDLAKAVDFLVGFQTFHALSYVPDSEGSLVLSLYGSARYNVFGKHGVGNDLELYLAPHLSYHIAPKLAFSLLYEMQAVHPFGAKVGTLENDGTDLEPGLEWAVTPNLSINPYINLYPGDKLTLKTSSFGMTIAWNIF